MLRCGRTFVQSVEKVLFLEAGGVAPESLGRWVMVQNYIASSSKAPDAPFCREDVLPVNPNIDPTKMPPLYRFVQRVIVDWMTWQMYDHVGGEFKIGRIGNGGSPHRGSCC